MPDSDIQRLVERIEGASLNDPELFWGAFAAVHGPKPERIHGGSKELDDYLTKSNPFFYMLKAGAFLDAAMTLVPEGWIVNRLQQSAHKEDAWCANLVRTDGGNVHLGAATAFCATPALALASAALRARITERTDDE